MVEKAPWEDEEGRDDKTPHKQNTKSDTKRIKDRGPPWGMLKGAYPRGIWRHIMTPVPAAMSSIARDASGERINALNIL